jgi:predicted DNA-binding transcriptional regulator YafY
VQPLHLGDVDGGWYLIAHDLERDALRTFALPRMKVFGPPVLVKWVRSEIDAMKGA